MTIQEAAVYLQAALRKVAENNVALMTPEYREQYLLGFDNHVRVRALPAASEENLLKRDYLLVNLTHSCYMTIPFMGICKYQEFDVNTVCHMEIKS